MAKTPKFRYPAAIIVWLDAHARNQAIEYTETEVKNLHQPNQCQILGLVIRDDEHGISLYNEETDSDSVRGASYIPKAMIKSITYVNLTPVRSKAASRPQPLKETRHEENLSSLTGGSAADNEPR